MSNIFVRFCKQNNSYLKKTWRAASFEPQSDEDENLQSEQPTSELASPGINHICVIVFSNAIYHPLMAYNARNVTAKLPQKVIFKFPKLSVQM